MTGFIAYIRSFDDRQANPASTQTGLNWLDYALVCLFLLGLYTNYTINISAKVPVACRRQTSS